MEKETDDKKEKKKEYGNEREGARIREGERGGE